MKTAIIALAFLATVSADVLLNTEPVPIVRQSLDTGFDGTYENSFEAGNGIKVEEHGVLKNAGTETQAEEVAGSVEYTAPDGTKIQLKYVANENGFQPVGDHLPVAPVDYNTAPPVPPQIARALDWIAAHPTTTEKS